MTIPIIVLSATCVLLLQLVYVRCASIQPRTSEEKPGSINSVEENIHSTEGEGSKEKASLLGIEHSFADQSDSQLIIDSPSSADETEPPAENIGVREGQDNSGLETGSSAKTDLPPGENSPEGVLSGDNSQKYHDGTGTLDSALNVIQARDQTIREDEEFKPINISSTDQSDSQLITDSPSSADETQQPGENISVQEELDNSGLELGSSGVPDLPPAENPTEGVLSVDNSQNYLDRTGTLDSALNASHAEDQTIPETEESQPLTLSSTDQFDSQLITDSPSSADEPKQPGENISVQEGLDNSGLELGRSVEPDLPLGQNSSEGVLSGDNSQNYLDGSGNLDSALNVIQAQDQTIPETEESQPITISSTDQSDSQLISDSPISAEDTQQLGENISVQEGLDKTGLELGSSVVSDLPPGENSTEGVLSGDNSQNYLDGTDTMDSALNASQARDQTISETEESQPLTLSSTEQSDSQLITDSPSSADETQQPGENISVQEELDNSGLELGSSGVPDLPPAENPTEAVLSVDNSQNYLDGTGTFDSALNASHAQDQTIPETEESQPLTLSSTDQFDSQLITDSPSSADETKQPGENISVQGLDNSGLELGSSGVPDLPPAENPTEGVLSVDNSQNYLDRTGTLDSALNASHAQDQTIPETEESQPLTLSSTDQFDSQLITDSPSSADEAKQPGENISVQEGLDNSGLELGRSVEPDLPLGQNSSEGVLSGDNSQNYLDGTGTLDSALNVIQAQDQTIPETEESQPITISSTDQSDSQLISDSPISAEDTQQLGENISVQEGLDKTGLELGSSGVPDLPPSENPTEGVLSGDNSHNYLDGTSTLDSALKASHAQDQTIPETEESNPIIISSTDQSDFQLITDSPSSAGETQQPGESIGVQEGLDNSGLELGSFGEPHLPPSENPTEGVLSGDISQNYLDGSGTLDSAINVIQAQDQTITENEESQPITISSTDQSDSQLITDSPSSANEAKQPGENISVQGLDNSLSKLGSSVEPDLPPVENSTEGVLSGDSSQNYHDGTDTLDSTLNASQAQDQTITENEESQPLTLSSTDQSDSQLITDSPSSADETQQPGENISVQEGLDNSGLELGSSGVPDLPPAENPTEGVLSVDNSQNYLDGTGTLDSALNASHAQDQTIPETEESQPLTLSSTDQFDSQLITDSPSSANEAKQPGENISVQGLDDSLSKLGSSVEPDLPPGENSTEGVLSGDNSQNYLDGTDTMDSALNASHAQDQTITETEESQPLTLSSTDQFDSQLITDSPSSANETQQPGENISVQGLDNSLSKLGSSVEPNLPPVENSTEGVLSGDSSQNYLDGTDSLDLTLNASQAQDQTITENEESQPITISSTDQSDSQLITDSPSSANEAKQPGENISVQGLDNSLSKLGSSVEPDLPPVENSTEGVLSGDSSQNYHDGTDTLDSTLNASQAQDQTITENEESQPLTLSSTDQSDSQLITDSPSSADETQQPGENISVQEGLDNSGLELGSSGVPDLPPAENPTEGVLSVDNSQNYLDGTGTLDSALNASHAQDQTIPETEESQPLTLSSTDQFDSQLITDSPSSANEAKQPGENISVQGLDDSLSKLGSSVEPDLPPGENSTEGVLSGDNSQNYLDGTDTMDSALNASHAQDQTITETEESQPLTLSSTDQFDSQLITDSPSSANEAQQPGENISVQGLDNSLSKLGSSVEPNLPPVENSTEGVLSGDSSQNYLDGTDSLDLTLNASQAQDQTITENEESHPITISSTDQSDSQLITDSPSSANEAKQPGENISVQGLDNSLSKLGSSVEPDLPPVENSTEGVLSGDSSQNYLDGTDSLDLTLNASQAQDQTITENEESKPITISSTDQSDSQLITGSPSSADETQQPGENIGVQEGLDNSGLELGSSGVPDLPPAENPTEGVLSGDNSQNYLDGTGTLNSALNASHAQDQTIPETEEYQPLTLSSTDQFDSQLITDSPSSANEAKQPGENISVQGLDDSLSKLGSSVEPDLPPGENSTEGVLSGDNSQNYLDGTDTMDSALNASHAQDQTITETEESQPLTLSSTDQFDSQLITDSPSSANEAQQPGENISVQGLDNSLSKLGSSVEPNLPPVENSTEGVLSGDSSQNYLDGTDSLDLTLNASQAQDQTITENEESQPITISSTDQSDSQLITDSPSSANEAKQPGENISVQGLDNSLSKLGSSVEPDLPPVENSTEGVLSGDSSQNYLDGTDSLDLTLNASQAQDQTITENDESKPITISSTDQSDSQLITGSPSSTDETQQPGENIGVQEGLDNSGLELGSSGVPDLPPAENPTEGVLSGDNSHNYLDGTGTLDSALNASHAQDQTINETEESQPLTLSSTDQFDSQLITDSPSSADEAKQPGENISVQEGLDNSGLELGRSVEPDLPLGQNSSEGVLSGDNSQNYLDGSGTLDWALNVIQAQDQTITENEESKPITISSTDQSDYQLITGSPSSADETQQPGENIGVQEGLDNSLSKLGSSVEPDLPPVENFTEGVLSGDISQNYLDGSGTLYSAINVIQAQDQTITENEEYKPITISSSDQSDSQLITYSPSSADETQQPIENVSIQEGLDNSGLELGSSGEPDLPPAENSTVGVLSGDNSQNYLDGTGNLDSALNASQAQDQTITENEESKPINISSSDQSDSQLITDSPSSADETQQPGKNIGVQEELDNSGLELGSSGEPDLPPAENSFEGVLSGDNSQNYLDGTGTLDSALNASQAQDQTIPETEESKPITISSTDQFDSQLITDSPYSADETKQPGENISVQGLDNSGLELGSSVEPDLPPGENSTEGVLSGNNSQNYLDGTGNLDSALNASQVQDLTFNETEKSQALTLSSTDQSDSQLVTDSHSSADESKQPGENISVQEGLDNSGMELGSSGEPDLPPGENSTEGVLSGDNSQNYLDGTGNLDSALNASQAQDQTITENEESKPITISSSDQSDSQLITDSPSSADETKQPGENISVQGLDNSGLELGSSGVPDLPPAENPTEGVLSVDNSQNYLDRTGTLDSALNASQAQEQTIIENKESQPITISSTDHSDSQLNTDSPSSTDLTQQPLENISVQEGLPNSGFELGSFGKPDFPPGENSSENVGAPSTFQATLNASQILGKSNPEAENSKLITSSSAVQSYSQLINHSLSLADETQQPAQSITVEEGLGNSGLELGSSGEADYPPGENYSRSLFSGEKSESYLDGAGTLEVTVNSGQANTEFEESKPIIPSSAYQSDLQLISVSPISSDETQQKQKNSFQEESGNTGSDLGTSCDVDSGGQLSQGDSQNSGGQSSQGGSQRSGGEPNLGGSQILSAVSGQTGSQCSGGGIQASYQSSLSESARNNSEIEGVSQGNSELESSFYVSQEEAKDGDAPIAGNPDNPGSPVAADDLMNKLNRGDSSKMSIYKIAFLPNTNLEAENSKQRTIFSTDHSPPESTSEQEYNGDAPIAGNPDNPGSPMAADDLISQLNRGGSAKKGIKESQPLENIIPEAEDTHIITIFSAIKSQPETTIEQGNNGDAPISGNPDNPGSPLAADDLLSLLNRGGSSKKDLNQSQYQYKTNHEADESGIKVTSSTDKSQPKSTNQPVNNSDAPIMRNADNPVSPQAADDLMSDLMVNGR